MTDDLAVRVEQACQHLLTAGAEVTFGEVATHAGIGRATLYRRPELRAIVEEHRQRGRDALTLTGLQVQIDQLRSALEAVAAKSPPARRRTPTTQTWPPPRLTRTPHEAP